MERVGHFEKVTGCELIFHFRRRLGRHPLEANRLLFYKYKLHQTHHRSAILLTLALKERQFAVWADEGVVRRSGDKLWSEVCQTLSQKLKQGHRLEALCAAVDVAENVLRSEQPHRDEMDDEISNRPIIEEGEDS